MFPIQNTVPSRYPPVINWVLIAINCGVFLYQIGLGPDELQRFLLRYALIPAVYFRPDLNSDLTFLDYLPFITNAFLHGGWLHLILNMWTLWLFGGTVEDRLGSLRYLFFYLFCGIVASVTHAFINAESVIPALGASGAIAGVLGCYVRLFPMARLVVLVPILFIPLFFEMPSIIFIMFWFLMQLLQGTAELFMPSTGGGVAWWAHVGGFIAGLVLGSLLVRPQRAYRRYYADEGVLGFTPRGGR
jgi:membrane associated rhomboid family serine protease